MAVGQIISRAIATGAIGADQIATGAITAADIPAGEITADKLHQTLDLSSKTVTMPQASITAHQAALSITESQISDLQSYVLPNTSPTFTNTTLTGYLAGPATFTIDPAGVGDNTGTVVIAGNLQVDGTTTTINSTTLTVDDLNITLADGAADAAAANGAGITVDGANATITYNATNDEWEFNKRLQLENNEGLHWGTGNGRPYIKGDQSLGTLQMSDGGTAVITIKSDSVGIGTDSPTTFGSSYSVVDAYNAAEGGYYLARGSDVTAELSTADSVAMAFVGTRSNHPITIRTNTQNRVTVDTNGHVGIGTTNPGTLNGVVSRLLALSGTNNNVISGTHQNVGLNGIILEAKRTGRATSERYAQIQLMNTSDDGSINFYTATSGTAISERVRIDANGNVGIGTDDPVAVSPNNSKLAVYDGGNRAGITLATASTSGVNTIYFADGTTGTEKYRGIVEYQHANDQLNLYASATRVATITTSGIEVNSGSFRTDQVRHSIRPTLNLDFANSKELDPRITFYRDSIATYYDSKGVLRYANVNKPRFDHDPATGESKGLLIEEARANIFNYTNNPEKWPLMSAGSSDPIVNNRKSPDGTYNATSLIITGGDPYFYQNNLTLNGTYTFSYWIKAWGNAVGKHYTIRTTNVSNNASIAKYLPSEWTRVSYTFTTSSTTTAYIGIEAPDSSPADGDEISIWGGQLELGAFATSLIPSDTRFTSRSSVATYHDETGILRTAPTNSPRYGYKYDGRKWVETGLILENAATNSIQNFFSNAGALQWSNGQNSEPVATSSVTAPDGSTTAFKQKINSTANAIHSIYDYGSVPVGQQLCFSVYAKEAEYDRIYLYTDGVAPTIGGIFYDLSSGTVSGGPLQSTDAYGIEDVGDGWYRCWFSGTPTSGATAYFHIDIAQSDNGRTFVGTVGEGVYLWGPQREYSAVPSSYIYTDTGNVTRSADVASSSAYTRAIDVAKINNINYSDWYNTKQGSIYVDFDPSDGSSSDAVVVGVGDGTSRGFRAPWLTGSAQIRAASWSGTAYSALQYYNSVTTTDQHKVGISFSYQDATFTSSLDGSTAQQETSWAGVETDATTMWIGGETDTNRPYSGTIAKVVIYNEDLTAAELQALTENN
jgi:hypothetical protein